MRQSPWVGWQKLGLDWQPVTAGETWKETYARLQGLTSGGELMVLRHGTYPTDGLAGAKTRSVRADDTPVQAEVLRCLQLGPATAAELEQKTGKRRGLVLRALGILAKKGYVYRGDGSKARSAGNRAAILWYLTRQEAFSP